MKKASLFLFLAYFSISGANATDFYEGKTIKLFAGTSAGSGSDVYYQLIQQFMGRNIPGSPNVIRLNMPAGGGMAAANYLYNVAMKDGTELAGFNRNSIFEPMLGNTHAHFRPEQFNWIGTPGSYGNSAYVFAIRSDLPYKTFEEMVRFPIPANVGKVGAANAYVAILQSILGAKMNLIIGYSEPQMAVALERGEIDGISTGYRTIVGTMGRLLDGKIIHPIVQFGHADRSPELHDVPTGREIAKNSDDVALIEFVEDSLTLGFPIGAPPSVPPDRIAILRKAFRETMDNSELKQRMETMKLDYSPIYGEDLQEAIAKLAVTPQTLVNRYRNLLRPDNIINR